MSWDQIIGHRNVLERFQKSAQRNRLASTYLFVGPSGIGKRTFALKLAQSLLCTATAESELNACGQCPSCQQVMSGSHPDLITVAKPADKTIIPVKIFIGDDKHRRQEGLIHDLGLKPFYGGRKFAIIDDADYLSALSADTLLKVLEEPPPNSILILIGTSPHKQKETILSRSQVVHFSALGADQVMDIIQRNGQIEGEVDLPKVVEAANGSVELAIRLSDPELLDFVDLLYSQLASLDPARDDFTKTLGTFVDSAGKDAKFKRQRLFEVGDFAICFYRDLLHRSAESNDLQPNLAAQGSAALDRFRHTGFSISVTQQAVAACIRRTLTMQSEIHANAMPANMIANWLVDLGRLCRAEASFEMV